MKENNCSTVAEGNSTSQPTDRLFMLSAIVLSLSVVTGTRVLRDPALNNSDSGKAVLRSFLVLKTMAISISLGVLVFNCVLHSKNNYRIQEERAIRNLVLLSLACFLAGLVCLGVRLIPN